MIERDALPTADEPRRAVPQGRHCHTLLPSGQLCLEELLPGILAELVADGAPTYRAMRELRCVTGGHELARGDTGRQAVLASRPFLEGHVRRRLAELPNIALEERCDAVGLLGDERRDRIVGVRLLRRAAGSAAEELSRRPRRGRHRPRSAAARLAWGARLSPPRRAAPRHRRRLRHLPAAAARGRARARQARARIRAARAAAGPVPVRRGARPLAASAPTGTAASTRRPTRTAFRTSSPRSPRRTSRRRFARPSRSTRSWRTAYRPTCAAATSACAGFPAGCCRSVTRSARSTRSTVRG